MTLAEAFALNPEETARLASAPFRGTAAAGWRAFAGAFHEGLIASYAEGELEFRRACELARACDLRDRIGLMANMVERLLAITPKTLTHRRPAHPMWLRRSAATLVEMLIVQFPEERLAPTGANNGRSSKRRSPG